MHSQSQSYSQKSFSFQRNVAILGVILFLGKLVAWQLTQSDAIFSDAMESIVNIVAAFMGLYSLYIASKPKDSDHPYGHGKVEFITSAIEGVMIIFAGIIIIIEAIHSFINGDIPNRLDWGMFIVFLTAVSNYVIGYISYQRGKRENSQILQSSGKHLKSDTITTFGVIVSLLIVHFTKWYWVDTLVAFAFGGYIIFTGYSIVRESLSGIMDEADTELIDHIIQILNKNRKVEWIDIHNMKIQRFGSRLHLDAHLTLPYYLELREAHNEMKQLIMLIVKHTDRPIEFNIHMDDCRPEKSCEVCQILDCPARQFSFKKKIEWRRENITQCDKHCRCNGNLKN